MKELYAIMLLMGTIIGAGIIGLPYAYEKSGFFIGLLNLIIIGTAVTFMTLYVGELSIRYKGKHQITGYVGKFLGKRWEKVALILETFGIYTALIAYYIGIGTSVGNIFHIDPKIISTIFFLIASPFVYFGTKSVSKSEFVLMSLKISIILTIFVFLISKINPTNFYYTNYKLLLYPFGITLFSLLGYTVMPEVSQIIDKRKIKKVVMISMISSMIIYLFFIIGFIGAFDGSISQIPSNNLAGNLRYLGDVLIFLILSTPYLALSLAVRDVYYLDFKIRKSFAWILACFVPFLIYLYSNLGFVDLLSISGAYTGGGLGILTMASILRARKKIKIKKEYMVTKSNIPIYFSLLIFIIGIAYETLYIIGIF